ncbi:DNA polymerase Y family protein [Microbacterium capsulatum]|uniref:DNA polymerase Y family protein n=1 Tax=Microbacterium capsulatum TaxID=3041921 RepID=A0ABU0XCU5_9MICO|nr:DNA polymerase Y family protein [Microbacterium sp. ASV81]MDQ4212921.1 DNA polymerase Y family protein [Microbacterium sp. ASV81]
MNAAARVPVRVIVLWFPDWPLRAALGDEAAEPAAILHANRVVACSAAARAQGVRIGQRRREAQGLLPALRILPADPARDERAFLPVLRHIEAHAPGAQLLRPGLALLRARGVARYHGGEQEAARTLHALLAAAGHPEVRIGIADGPFTAELAARGADPALVVAPGEAAAFLAPLPVQALAQRERGDEEITALLLRLGVRTLGDLAALGAARLRDRFGERGARLHALAAGADSRPVVPRPADPELAAEVEFESPLGQSDQIAFAVRQSADAVILALAEASLVCTEVRIDLTDDDERVTSRTWLHPTCFEASDLVDRVRWQLESLADEARGDDDEAHRFRGIARVRIAPVAVDDAAHHQPGLFGSGPDERLHHAVSRVQTLLGHEGVVTGVVAGGRLLADRQQLTPWGERVVPARPADQPWPGQLPDPLPAEVFVPLRPIAVTAADGADVGVDERGLLTAAPAAVDSCPVLSWAGPWSVRDRRGDPAGIRRGERLQIVDVQERAWLVMYVAEAGAGGAGGGRWWAEGRYH